MLREVQRLTPDRVADFFRLHSQAHQAGWCYCTAWWVPTWEGWGERSQAANRALRQELFARGQHDGYLLYADREPVAWCQVGLRDRLEKLRAQYGLQPDPQAWAITCFFTAPSQRRQGHARHLLGAVMRDLKARGVRRLEAFPRRGPALEPGDLWTGPESLFLQAGFRVARDDARRPLLALEW